MRKINGTVETVDPRLNPFALFVLLTCLFPDESLLSHNLEHDEVFQIRVRVSRIAAESKVTKFFAFDVRSSSSSLVLLAEPVVQKRVGAQSLVDIIIEGISDVDDLASSSINLNQSRRRH